MIRCRILSTWALMAVMSIGAAAGLAQQKTHFPKAAEPGVSSMLHKLPADSQFIFGVHVRRIVTSPLYVKSGRKRSAALQKELPEFIKGAGLDPERDIEYLVGAGRALAHGKSEGVAIMAGSFSRAAVVRSLRAQGGSVEQSYGGSALWMVPERRGGSANLCLAFLAPSQIVAGDAAAVKKVLAAGSKTKPNPLPKSSVTSLIAAADTGDMIWCAGDVAAALAVAPMNVPLGPNASSIMNVAGAFNIADSFAGKVTITAADLASAARLADVAKGLVAFSRLSGDKNPELKALTSGVTVLQDATRVRIELDFPAALLRQIEAFGGLQARRAREQ